MIIIVIQFGVLETRKWLVIITHDKNQSPVPDSIQRFESAFGR